VKRERGVGRDGDNKSDVSRIGRRDIGFEEARGLDRRDVFRRRTGPGPEAGNSGR